MFIHVRLHHLGEDMREHEHLAFALVRMCKVSEHFADQFAIHLARGIAHFFVTHGDSGLAHAKLQLLNYREHRLSAGGASVFHGLNRLTLEARCSGHQACQQSLLVQRKVAGGAHAAHVQCRCRSAHLAAGPLNRSVQNLGHGHAHQLAEPRLVKRRDIDWLHNTIFAVLVRFP